MLLLQLLFLDESEGAVLTTGEAKQETEERCQAQTSYDSREDSYLPTELVSREEPTIDQSCTIYCRLKLHFCNRSPPFNLNRPANNPVPCVLPLNLLADKCFS